MFSINIGIQISNSDRMKDVLLILCMLLFWCIGKKSISQCLLKVTQPLYH